MTANVKIWVHRVVSVPVLLFLPLLGMAIGGTVTGENQGDSIPFLSMLGLLAGATAAAFFSKRTVFASIACPLARRYRMLGFAFAVEIALVAVMRAVFIGG
jgi:hypothetical protein